MEFLRFRPDLSKMWVDWWLPGKVGRESRSTAFVTINVGWPAFIPCINMPGRYIKRGKLSLTNAEVQAGYSCYVVEPGDSLLPDPATLSYKLVQAPIKVPTKDYAKRKQAGEVLMNDYAVGEISVQRTAGYDFTGGTAVSNRYYGWFTYSTKTGMPCAAPYFGQRPGETFCSVSVNLAFELVSVKNAAYDISPPPVFLENSSSIDTGLVTSVVADCNNGTYDLLTELGELPETLEFVTESTKKAFFIGLDADWQARAMKKSLPAVRFAKWLTNHWLKLRYALLPIFYSIGDVSKVLASMGSEYAEYKAQKVLNDDVPLNLMSGALTVTVEGDCIHRCYIKSRYTPDSIISDFRRLINMNLLNSAWELTKLSFVADWVINVGDFLSAVSGSDGSTESKCCYSVRDNRSVTLSYSDGSVRPKTTVVFRTYKRQVINPLDHTGLTLQFDMNWKRYIDACSLSLRPALKIARSLK